jgi:hypothetical protein
MNLFDVYPLYPITPVKALDVLLQTTKELNI